MSNTDTSKNRIHSYEYYEPKSNRVFSGYVGEDFHAAGSHEYTKDEISVECDCREFRFYYQIGKLQDHDKDMILELLDGDN